MSNQKTPYPLTGFGAGDLTKVCACSDSPASQHANLPGAGENTNNIPVCAALTVGSCF